MKKVFLSLAVLFSVALVSCGGHKAQENQEDTMAPETALIVDEGVVEDTLANDSVVNESVAVVAGAVEVENPEATK